MITNEKKMGQRKFCLTPGTPTRFFRGETRDDEHASPHLGGGGVGVGCRITVSLKVDKGIADVEAGKYLISESVESELAAEFGLANK